MTDSGKELALDPLAMVKQVFPKTSFSSNSLHSKLPRSSKGSKDWGDFCFWELAFLEKE
jgi:hypothetical protein